MLLRFGGHEMAQVVNGTQALSAMPGTQRAPRGKTKEAHAGTQRAPRGKTNKAHTWAADRCRRSTGKMAERER
jgi:hypothetical protein